jgi:hypothetical protein
MPAKVSHPLIAFCIIFIITALLSEYGVSQGSLLLFDVLAGVVIYKTITFQS